MQLQLTVLTLLLLALGVAYAYQLDEVHDENEREAWLAGVFTPQPLKPAPWQTTTPTYPPIPTPPPRRDPAPGNARVQVPGVGEVQGLAEFKRLRGRAIDAWLGVRYGQVGSGLGRFQQAKPVPYESFINATRQSENCAQFPELPRLQQAEARGENVDDCLTLNIYAPAAARELPVLVFVHGEMLFDGGAEEAQPDYLLEHDVVLVSINYRLAPFGFLTALSEELPGNVALSDLHLALEWVQRNIRYFGGAANQVTLMGQAGGATLAHALSLSTRTQHLFQQLILQSGTALNPYFIDEQPLNTLATFARLAHCPMMSGNLSPLYQCLSRLRSSQLVEAFQQLHQQQEPRGLSALGGFKLVVGDALGYLPEHPAALLASNNASMPTIMGAAKDASAFILSRFYEQIQQLQSGNLSDYINVVLRHVAPPQQHKLWHDWAIREIFTPEQQRFANARSVFQGLLELSNLILYRAPVIYSIRGSYRKTPAYLYTFDYRGEHHRFAHFGNPLPFGVDASLSDDSVYLFPYPAEASRLNPEDQSLARALCSMWVSFAQSGIPNPNGHMWPKASSEYGPFLRFTNNRTSILELDQHFGDGINVPNLYGQSSSGAVLTTTSTTTTTTTTTRRPYPYYTRIVYRPTPPAQQPQPQNPQEDPFVRIQEQRRQQWMREQRERERMDQERERQQREQLLREEEERKREQWQQAQQLLQEQQRREELEREQLLREQQQRELAARQQHEQQADHERSQEDREEEAREQQAREQQRREQLEREREQAPEHEREREQQTFEAAADGQPDPSAYPTYEEYVVAHQAWIQQQESLYNPQAYASAEEEESAPVESAPPHRDANAPQLFKFVRRQQQRLRF
ncbi:Glt [Drosophila busckii]|uniref:Glt n=1 Tax=Drosophila busckii TaxID=30019 RepID=A0A0M3QTI9_DROBS|nr:Glt [Drosophila busckii]